MRQTDSLELETSPLAGVIAALLRTLQTYADAVRYARRVHREYTKLSTKNEAALRKIGISRSDIPAVVMRTCGTRGKRLPSADASRPRLFNLPDRYRKPRRSFRRLSQHRDYRRI